MLSMLLLCELYQKHDFLMSLLDIIKLDLLSTVRPEPVEGLIERRS